ncbi:Ankyrin repeat domain-containing protein 29 [Mizuhopecten yessoensis]|uniref:Ankyrin repeat domain-containing protein 29 n=1 Tax=Mizuhopecten yessoensis TaxID=6573 RepID=A0A210PTM5_MIZYE|nr:Ankyrin repeat domain-containing protein 29 [Mizuhopecten yessoensis]
MVDGATSLFITAQNGHLKLLKYLISKGADVNAKRQDQATPLWIASQMGHVPVVRELLLANAEVDALREDGATPLFKACHKGHLEVTEQLLRYKPTLGLLQNGETPLHAAALFGHMKVIKLLLSYSVDTQIKNKEGKTAVELAREAGYDYIAKFVESYVRSSTPNGSTSSS